MPGVKKTPIIPMPPERREEVLRRLRAQEGFFQARAARISIPELEQLKEEGIVEKTINVHSSVYWRCKGESVT